MVESIKSLLHEGRLDEAIAAVREMVRSDPAADDRRRLLAELLCIAADFEAADRQLAVLARRDPQRAVGAALFRRLIDGERRRREFFANARPPRFFAPPPERLSWPVAAARSLGEGRPEEAMALLERAEAARPHPHGRLDGTPFDDLRDADDLVAGVFELIAGDGDYYWVPVEAVRRIDFRPVERPRDLVWRQAAVSVADGPEGNCFLPSLYVPPAAAALDDRLRLGWATEWVGGDGRPVQGVGQRLLVAGDAGVPFATVECLELAAAGGGAAAA